MRGLFSAGVMDALMEEGLRFDGAIGVSAGACFGCNYKSRQIGRTLRYHRKYCRDPRYCSLQSLITTGDLYGADFCYRRLPQELDPFDYESYRKDPMPFYAVCTDVVTGEAKAVRLDTADEEDMKWMRASASMPLVSRPVAVAGGLYLDGGIADSIPLARFEAMGYEKNVVVLTQPRDYEKTKSSLLPLMKIALRKYPLLYEAMKHRHENYNESRRLVLERERQGRCFLFCPEEALPVGRTEKDPEKLTLAWEWGYRQAKSKMNELKHFLQE